MTRLENEIFELTGKLYLEHTKAEMSQAKANRYLEKCDKMATRLLLLQNKYLAKVFKEDKDV